MTNRTRVWVYWKYKVGNIAIQGSTIVGEETAHYVIQRLNEIYGEGSHWIETEKTKKE